MLDFITNFMTGIAIGAAAGLMVSGLYALIRRR